MNSPARRRRALLCLFVFTVLPLLGTQIDPNRYLSHIKYLASPQLKGRGAGTPGLEKAANYIARQFRQAGLQPVDHRRYFQPFPVTINARIGPHNHFQYAENGHSRTLKLEQEFEPFNFSDSGKFSGTVVFAGYGITAPEYHYDDYSGIDVKDKIVLVLRHEPQENDEKSVFAGKMLTGHAQFWSKAVNAKQHGARAVILVNDRANHPADADELEKFGRTAGPINAGIPFLQMRAAAADEWLRLVGKSVEQLGEAIDKEFKPQSFALPDSLRVSADIELNRDVKTVRNVAGYLPGETDEYVIIGAHYDHLGLGDQHSLAPSQIGTVHPGADDNASGTAGVIELARWFATQGRQKRGVLFLCFAGEELGLLGSRYYVDHPDLPLKNAVAMINLDMIGRLRNHKVYVGGAGSGTNFKALLAQDMPKYKLESDFSGTSESGSSDHTSFTTQQIPALFFFSGLHGDYHKPSDTWDKINPQGATELLDAVADLSLQLVQEPERPQFVRVAPPQSPGPVSGVGGSGYGPWFGSIPDFGETPKGVKFAGIQPGSPAEKAGLRSGDILVEFDGKQIANLFDFTYALRAKKPGDTVRVKVLRGGQTVEATVVLAQRK